MNRILEALKRFPLFKLLYRLSFAPSLYHFTLALGGAIVYGFPSRRLTVIGVTGTKGKTTTIELINAGLEAAGEKTALLSSWRIKIAEKSELNVTGNTQPGRFYSQFFLREALRQGCKFALIEIGSEGVVRHRHRFINFDAAVFVNIHPEHIESHGSFERYRKAKLDFFRYVSRGGKQKKFFINQDDPNADLFVEAAGGGEIILAGATELPLQVEGDFNRVNAGLAVAVLRAFGVAEGIISKALSGFRGVPGRMEFVVRSPFAVVVDYAHTPDSLEAVYRNLKKNTQGNLICVLGSAGGGRDKWKRPKMGAIAEEYCQSIYLTDEDPFDEEPMQILDEIEAGIKEKNKVKKIIDRREAIRTALGLAKEGDVVVISGKGSEPYIRIDRGRRIPWSDVDVVKKIINK